ncbi:MAG: type I methionyl aminopeptidase [Cyclobacteriaceae bacterium]|nr:type I methionyl aminopeptidase [Cyclobacteriaceae bacterium]
MIHYKTREEVEIMKEGAIILGKAHGEVAKWIVEGEATDKLDAIAEEFIRDMGGQPSFKNYNGFPASLCISVNEQVVHGIPGSYRLREGDVVSIDCGVYYKGYHSDSAYTYPVNVKDENLIKLLRVTKESLWKGISAAKFGNRIGDISFAVQQHVSVHGYGIVRELVGHGVGKALHESPEVPNYGKKGKGVKLKDGLVIAIEPMINLGAKNIVQEADGWTIRTADRKASVHFEHTVAIFEDQTEVITTHEYIEKNFKGNNG